MRLIHILLARIMVRLALVDLERSRELGRQADRALDRGAARMKVAQAWADRACLARPYG